MRLFFVLGFAGLESWIVGYPVSMLSLYLYTRTLGFGFYNDTHAQPEARGLNMNAKLTHSQPSHPRQASQTPPPQSSDAPHPSPHNLPAVGYYQHRWVD